MRLVIQRVLEASVKVSDKIVGQIDHGLLVLVGFGKNNQNSDLAAVAQKLLELRIFANAEGRFDLSVSDVQGGILLVPQFTLFGDARKGRRPDFFSALPGVEANLKFTEFVDAVRSRTELPVETGEFGADMQVALINDGPVTIIYDSEA